MQDSVSFLGESANTSSVDIIVSPLLKRKGGDHQATHQ
jgi:hypothetical protein